MANILANVTVSPWDIVDALEWDYERIVEFIVEMDESMSDLGFTIELRDKLNEIISKED